MVSSRQRGGVRRAEHGAQWGHGAPGTTAGLYPLVCAFAANLQLSVVIDNRTGMLSLRH
jgi:hypothetical protein